ncbi:E3 ubiquitin-protein ligase At3g02290-like [Aristolochia californica]|uniref:E3 ubiquitin-protein ligase At3g02290-like n=1 Tax=Aristolochia californica TaxID=171875 RepID=UPI0035D969B8
MGALCCCPCSEEFDEYAWPSSSIYRHCTCLRYFLHQLFSGYSATFQRLEGRTVTSPVHGVTSLASNELGPTSSDTAISDPYNLSLLRPVPYDADPRYSRVQRDGLVSRRDKILTHVQEETQPLCRSSSSSCAEPLVVAKKWTEIDCEEGRKAVHSESLEKSTKVSRGVNYIPSSSEDEDVCPTCLDEYTSENPKIVTQCSHHFHLSCIYEWMERSENCPLCGKEMEFSESP